MKSDGKINTFALNGKTKIEKLRFYFLIFYCPAFGLPVLPAGKTEVFCVKIGGRYGLFSSLADGFRHFSVYFPLNFR